jgi:hypothetical protein
MSDNVRVTAHIKTAKGLVRQDALVHPMAAAGLEELVGQHVTVRATAPDGMGSIVFRCEDVAMWVIHAE